MSEPVFITVDRDGITGGLQLSIGTASTGYRLAGPKFNGSSKTILKHELDEWDAIELERYIAPLRAAKATGAA